MITHDHLMRNPAQMSKTLVSSPTLDVSVEIVLKQRNVMQLASEGSKTTELGMAYIRRLEPMEMCIMFHITETDCSTRDCKVLLLLSVNHKV